MKKIYLLSVMALTGLFMLQSCDDELFDVNETFTFEHEFAVFATETTVADSDVIDLSAKEVLIEQYGSKIKKIEIESIRYWLKRHEGSQEQTLQSSYLRVANADGSDVKEIVSLNNVKLADLYYNPTDLNPNMSGVTKLAGLIESPPHNFMLLFGANVNDSPVDFTVVFEFKAKMTANPLK
jgi:hypothetical protein